jgi:type VI secretion system protein VasG
MIAKRIQSRAKLDNPNCRSAYSCSRTSGVGKTETALALAESLYGGEQNVITINMSEFQEAHTVSTLKGAPPGYVGYGEGGVLTEAVRRRPYSVVLLDEVEKAHPDVHEIFFQVFDKGGWKTARGVTSISEHHHLAHFECRLGRDHEPMQGPGTDARAGRHAGAAIRCSRFSAGAARSSGGHPLLSTVRRDARHIVRLQLGRIKKRIQNLRSFDYDEDVVKLVVSRCTEGRRRTTIDAISQPVLPTGRGILKRMVEGKPVTRVRVGVANGDFGYGFDWLTV